jgi:tetratricopeptide (TPR) repeat protein
LSLEFENYANTGQLAKALPLLDRVESLDPHNWIPDLLRGWSQAQAHHLDEAITSYRKALDKNGDKEKLIPLLASALREKGAKAEALKICAKASAELPDSMPILVAYEAIVAEGNDRKTDALLLKRMLEKEPFTYSTHLKLSKLYWEAGQQDEALPYLKQIAELYPADVTSRALLAEYYVSKDQPSLAIPLLEQALQRVENTDPARPQLRSSLANAYLKNAIALSSGAKYEEAGEAAEKASELLPTDLPALSVAVENFAQAKNFRRAEAGLQKLIRLQPDNPTLYLSLGDVEAQQGRTAEAREHWQMALERVPAADTELRPELQSRLNPPDSAVK